MLKHGKHVCRRICAKSVRLILGRYSEYLICAGMFLRIAVPMCALSSILGGGWGGGVSASPMSSSSWRRGCQIATVRESVVMCDVIGPL